MECGELTHSIAIHIKNTHPALTVEQYQEKHPDAPLFSELAEKRIEEKRLEIAKAVVNESNEAKSDKLEKERKESMSDVFGLGKVKSCLSANGDPIMITILNRENYNEFIPEIDKNYIFQIGLLKNVLMGIEMNIPTYLWGHAGVGKSSVFEQVCAYTKRPYIRVQHTANTEESHIVGQTLANKDGTYFEPGPLAIAMRYGLVYNADEYDFAHASVVAVYQPVLEGKSLVIKEATPDWRIVKPHRDFRFVATGNTNGNGDDTGLYAGTNLGNSANYSRFGITDHVKYMDRDIESKVIASQSGIDLNDAKRLVEFANAIRGSFQKGEMSVTIGPRELIYAARLGLATMNWTHGIALAFANRLPAVDFEIVSGVMNRHFSAEKLNF